MKKLINLIIFYGLISSPAQAGNIFLTTERQSDYLAALDDLTIAIANHDYTLIKIQPVDQGLRRKGFETTSYKVVFFGDNSQVNQVLITNPEASVILPLKIILYQQGETVIASAPDLSMWEGIFDNGLTPIIKEWQRDMHGILQEFANQ